MSHEKGIPGRHKGHKDKNRKHGHHESTVRNHHSHFTQADTEKGHHGRHKGLRKTPIEFLKNEAVILEKKLQSIQQRIKDMEEGKISSELKAIIDPELCIGCGKCESACKHGAITINEFAVVDNELCVGCGHCIDRCRDGAITL